jgi:hypothetical protein
MPLCSSITSISYNDEQKLIAGKFSQSNERNGIASLALHSSFAHIWPTSLTPIMQEKKPIVKAVRCGITFQTLPCEEVVVHVERVTTAYHPPAPVKHEPR